MPTKLFSIWGDPKPYPLQKLIRSNMLSRFVFYPDKFKVKLMGFIPSGTKRIDEINAFRFSGDEFYGVTRVHNGILLTYTNGKKDLLSIYGKENSDRIMNYLRERIPEKEEK